MKNAGLVVRLRRGGGDLRQRLLILADDNHPPISLYVRQKFSQSSACIFPFVGSPTWLQTVRGEFWKLIYTSHALLSSGVFGNL